MDVSQETRFFLGYLNSIGQDLLGNWYLVKEQLN